MRGYINVTLVGNVGKDPEIRSTGSGKKLASFSVAVNQGFGDSEKTEWVNCIAWSQLADVAEKYLKKGKTVGLSGTLQTSSWEDKQTGAKRYKTEVVARDITFLDSGRTQEGNGRTQNENTRRESSAPVRREAPSETEPFDDDIPF